MTTLVVYGTGEGQTAKVAGRVVDHLDELGHEAEVYDVDDLPTDLDVTAYDAVLVGASIHRGRQQKSVRRFVERHRDDLARRPSGFFQVSLSAAVDDETHHTEAMGYVDDLVESTGWHPDRVAVFGGALRYSEYGFITRSLMKAIAKNATGDTDTSRDYEYTDWEEVRAFAAEFAAFVDEQRALHERAATDFATDPDPDPAP
jgi:menaquinone-dependent protoporphyrinogen oxidase